MYPYIIPAMFTQKLSRTSFKSEERYTIKIISINRKTSTQLEQTFALRFSSLFLVFSGKRDFEFSSFKMQTELSILVYQVFSVQR